LVGVVSASLPNHTHADAAHAYSYLRPKSLKIEVSSWGESIFFRKKMDEISKIEDCSELSESLALIFSGIEVRMT